MDPVTDVESVRAFARSAVEDHDQRSLTGAVRPVGDLEAVVDALVARVVGFGPLQPHLDDHSIEGVWINSRRPAVVPAPTPQGVVGAVA